MYNEDFEPYYYSFSQEEAEAMQDRLALAQEHLENLIKNLCSPCCLDVEGFKDSLLELCHNLEVEYPHNGNLPIIKYDGKMFLGGI